MSYFTLCQRVRRFFRKREVRVRLAQVPDPRQAKGRRWPLRQVGETVVGGLLLQVRSCHQLDERTRAGPPRRVGEVRLAPIPDATVQWLLPQLDRSAVRQALVDRVRPVGAADPVADGGVRRLVGVAPSAAGVAGAHGEV